MSFFARTEKSYFFSHRNRRRIAGVFTFVIIGAVWGFAQGIIYSGKLESIDLAGDIRDFFHLIAPASGFQLDIDRQQIATSRFK